MGCCSSSSDTQAAWQRDNARRRHAGHGYCKECWDAWEALGEYFDPARAPGHVEKRQDKSTRDNYILRLLPENLITKPRQCKTQVIIDHYKFIAGVTKHLVERMNSYRKLNLTWWKQSLEILKNIKSK